MCFTVSVYISGFKPNQNADNAVLHAFSSYTLVAVILYQATEKDVLAVQADNSKDQS